MVVDELGSRGPADLELADLSSAVIAAAIEVHRALGPGFVEAVYARALLVELRLRGIRHESERSAVIEYRGQRVGRHVLDLLVDGRLVVELKAARRLEDAHYAVARSYLRAIGLEHGLLLNFGHATLVVRRVIRGPVR